MNSKTATLDQISNTLLEIYDAARQTSLEEFRGFALKRVRSCLQFCSSWWGEGTMTSGGLEIHQSYTFNQPDDLAEKYQTVRSEDNVTAGMFDSSNSTSPIWVIPLPPRQV